VQVVNSQRYRVKQGQALNLRYIGDNTSTVRAWARVRYDTGEDQLLIVPDQTLNDDREVAVARPSDVALHDGWVTDALVELLDTGIKRGQVYVKLGLEPFGPALLADYCFSSFGQVALGTFVQPGPGGGAGHLEKRIVSADGPPSASRTATLALSSTIRKIYGFAWYYQASGTAASRVLQVRIRDYLGPMPTGKAEEDAWFGTDVTLTANENGSVAADEQRSWSGDGTPIVIDNTASAPSPFPRLIEENDTIYLIFVMQNEEATDFDTIQILQETWVMP